MADQGWFSPWFFAVLILVFGKYGAHIHSEQKFVKSIIKKLGLFHLCDQVNPTTSHVITGDNRRTLNILYGITQGCWVVSPAWASKSEEKGCWVDETPFELGETFPAAKKSRLEKQETGMTQHGVLFEESPIMYIAENTVPPHEVLVRLITRCGGQVTTSIRKAGICIGHLSNRRDKLPMVNEKWVLDCITASRAIPYEENYLIESKRKEPNSPEF